MFNINKEQEKTKMSAGMGDAIHCTTDSSEPPAPEQDVVRVYGMKLCPFTHRLKLVLAAKGIKHETININLKSKPKWFLKKSPTGCVPVLEVNGELIRESDITSRYIDEAYPGKKLSTIDPLKKAQEQMLISDYAMVIQGYYGAAITSDSPINKSSGLMKLKEGLEALDKHLEKAGTPFVCGSGPGLTDYLLWPHLERIGAIVPICISQFLFVQAFYDRMGENEAVKACRWTNTVHRRFIESVRNKKPDYDMSEE